MGPLPSAPPAKVCPPSSAAASPEWARGRRGERDSLLIPWLSEEGGSGSAPQWLGAPGPNPSPADSVTPGWSPGISISSS